MTSDSTRPLSFPLQAQAELELFQFISSMDEQAYPWNPADPEAETYFAQLEQEIGSAGWMAEEIAIQGQTLATHFEQLWATVLPGGTDASPSLLDDLIQRFSAQVPHHFLEGIVQGAQQALAANRSLADQLVMCVQELLPNWGEDDLQVLARPLAYAMRGSESLESVLTSVQHETWTDLSSVDQAKLTLAIARYAISQLSTEPMSH